MNEECQNDLGPGGKSTPDFLKRSRKPTVSPQECVGKKPEEKRPKTSKKEKEWTELSGSVRKKEPKPRAGKPERSRRARPEAVLVKPAEGVSYVTILRSLKSWVNSKERGIAVQGIRETRSKCLLVEMRCNAKDRYRLGSVFRDVVGEQCTVRHLVPMVQVEILDLDPTAEKAEVKETMRSCLYEDPSAQVKVSLTRRPFKGVRKAFVQLEDGSPAGDAGGQRLADATVA